ERVTIYQVRSATKDKLETLSALLRTVGDESSVVFLNYRESVERTASFLKDNGFTVSVFHGGLEQKEREDALYKFSNGSANILVCTDLASRGLDIPDIRHIIHYQLPLGEDGYVHRVGRTARWDATGNSYFILGPGEDLPEYVVGDPAEYQLPPEEQLPLPVPPRMVTLYIGKGKQDKISKGDIVGFLCKIGGASKEDIGRIDVKERYSYVAVRKEIVRQVLRQTNGEKIKKVKTVVEIVK
ncbi:MAG: DbpA RNA binding domain-containing protein, partial [Prevotella sp.]|nr:DbpA RNA binding domain-containing protein [Prevotella sp.]